MTRKTRDRLTTVMDIAVAGLLALVPVAVVGSWWVGAVVFGLGVMWVLRPKEPRVSSARKAVDEGDDWSDEINDCQGYSYDYRNGFRDG